MSYTVNLPIWQSNPTHLFSVAEQTVWSYANGGDWSQSFTNYTLTMGGSGTSGTLRFKSSDNGEHFLVAVGVDGGHPWLDIVPDMTPSQTGVVVNGWYYNGGQRTGVRTSHKTDYNVTTKKGTTVQVMYMNTQGNYLEGEIIIG